MRPLRQCLYLIPFLLVACSSKDLQKTIDLFTEYSDRPIPTLGARMTVSFALACDRIRSMGVSRPVFVNTLTFTGGVSPDQIIFLRESDYACGDTLRFVYFAEDDVFHVRLERP